MKFIWLAALVSFAALICFMLVDGISTINHDVQAHEAEEVAHHWRMNIVFKTYDAIDRMYQCTTEIYSTLHGGGPICKDACKQYADIRQEEQRHLAWMDGQELIPIPDPKVCGAEDKRTEEK